MKPILTQRKVFVAGVGAFPFVKSPPWGETGFAQCDE